MNIMEFQTGDRNNHFSEYAFHLAKLGISPDEIQETIISINDFIMDDPLETSEIETILRPETMEKLQEIESIKVNGAVSPEVFQSFLNGMGLKLKYNELLNIDELAESLSKIINSSEFPDVVFIDEVPEGLQIDERYYGKTSKGVQNRNNRRKVYKISSDELETILSHYEGSTRVFMKEGELK